MKKLNSKGFAHIAALAIVVVGLAAFGTYMLVASHASTYDPRISGYASYGCKSTDTLRRGSKGACVKTVQYGLINWMIQCRIATPRITIDGSYGPATVTAVKVFQTKHGLGADGVFGQGTWNAFFNERAIYPGAGCAAPTGGK